jgi:ecotin
MSPLIPAVVLAIATLPAMAADPMQAFPPPEAGMSRYVIKVPALADEADRKVELIVGRTERVDERNRYFLAGTLEKETIRGWGYDRYVVSTLGPMAGTLIAVDPNAPKVERFVALGGEPRLLRYNSKLPIVVYVPDGAEVRYRIWKADPRATPAEKG